MLIKLSVVCFIVFSLPFKLYAWNAVGHMVVANIAYQQLHPNVRATVDKLVTQMNQDYSGVSSFTEMSVWPDALRGQKIETYTHWHYIDESFSTDGTPLKNVIDTDNALWATNQIVNVVKNTHANPNERARFLAFLVHIISDLHQPLHTVSYFSSTHPDGDRGGNDYYIKNGKQSMNMHSLWDGGAGIFNNDVSKDHINSLTNTLVMMYPLSSLKSHSDELTPDTWVKEGMDVAKQYVYVTPENADVSTAYLKNAQMTAEQRATLAGYRVAAMLNVLLDKG